jgi:hypothetical protein
MASKPIYPKKSPKGSSWDALFLLAKSANFGKAFIRNVLVNQVDMA